MDREIKFRAWFPEDHWIAEKYGQMIKDYTSKTIFEITGFWEEDVKYMQYTGLKDKDGQEIYEGDILKPAIDLSHYNVDLLLVEWIAKMARFGLSFTDPTTGEKDHFDLSFTKSCRVVGNIHENPELLD